MHLTIKPIINGLFQASVSHEKFTATAIGETQHEAAKRALDWLQKEVERNSTANDIDFEHIKNNLTIDEQGLCVGDLSQSNAVGSSTLTNTFRHAARGSAGAALLLSGPIIKAAATTVGIAKTGTAIGTLHGAAHASATAAWVGFGSMKVGMFIMGALPIIGTLLILDNICGREHGVPLIDWYEEGWRRYEAQCELDELKKTVKPDVDHQVRAKTQAGSLAQLGNQFRALEVEHDLYLLKKQMGLI